MNDARADEFDLLVIGAGVAGVAAASACADGGWRVAITDPLPYGGTCPLRGCDPKKILRRGAEVVDAAERMSGRGIASVPAIDWGDLVAYKRGYTDGIPRAMESSLRDAGVETLHERARFVAPDAVEIGGRRIRARRFLIATGARPRTLGIPGEELVTDSTGFMELDELPARIVFVGGGFVSFEFAHIAARAGARCTIVHRHDRPLTGFDPELVDALVDETKHLGIEVVSGADASGVSREEGALVVELSTGDRLESDLVVHGGGRVPHLDALGLDAGGIAHGRGGVVVTEGLRSTTNPRVYAAGDVADTAGRPLTPVASLEGSRVAQNLLADADDAPDYAGIPSTVFSLPELTRVGMLEEEARSSGRRVRVTRLDTSGWYSSYRVGARTARIAVVIDEDTDLVLGAHLLGTDYADLVGFFAAAISLGVTASRLATVTAAYPTVGSDLSSML